MSTEELAIHTRKQAVNDVQTQIVKGVVQYCNANDLKHSTIYKYLSVNGLNLDKSNLTSLHKGRYQRQLSIYTLVAICESVGLSIFDFVEIKQPGKKEVEKDK